MKLRVIRMAALLALAAVMLSGCRYAVVESGYVRVEAPAATSQP